MLTTSNQHCSFHVIFQFTNISLPGMIQQHIHGSIVDSDFFFMIQLTIFSNKIAGQQLNIFLSLPQRRQRQRNHIDSIIQILSEFAVFHRLF